MSIRITDQDLQHLQAFPGTRKVAVMQKIMSLAPSQITVLEGNNHFEKAVLGLRRGGYSLIDLQSVETAFTTVWYRRGKALLGLAAGAYVTMLLWEAQDCGESTTQMTWRV